jgi:PGF-pre-PGF domain-containing protein
LNFSVSSPSTGYTVGDNVPPTVTTSSPTSNQVFTTTTNNATIVLVNVTINGTGTEINQTTFLVNGATVPSTCNSIGLGLNNCAFTLSENEGIYNLSVVASDYGGNTNTENIPFTVSDGVPPVVNNTSPTPSSTSALLSVTTDESATCKYDTGDNIAYAAMMYNFTDNSLTHTATVDLSLLGNNYYVRCADLAGNPDSASTPVTLTYNSSSPSGSSTGGTNTGGGTQPQGDPSQTFNVGLLSLGTKIISVDNANIPVMDVLLTASKISPNVNIVVTAVSSPSTTYSETVYKYIQFDHPGLDDSGLSDVKIKIFVAKSWLTSNNINKSDIVLLRYTNNWTALNTSISSEDTNYVYYLADSPGLSLFAISKKTSAMVATATALNATSNNLSKNNTANNTATSLLDTSNRHFNWTWVIILSVIVFIIIILFVLVRRNEKNSPPPIFPEERTFWGKLKRLFK